MVFCNSDYGRPTNRHGLTKHRHSGGILPNEPKLRALKAYDLTTDTTRPA